MLRKQTNSLDITLRIGFYGVEDRRPKINIERNSDRPILD